VIDRGSYHLLIHVPRPTRRRIGKLGTFTFPAGYYVYTGSARRGLRARVRRHLNGAQRRHWHIDYLLASPSARIVRCLVSRSDECRRNASVKNRPGARLPVPGFGSSDCRRGCGSHLVYFARKPDLKGEPFDGG